MPESDEEVQKQILEHLKSIPILNRLEDAEILKIYGICQFKKYDIDAEICKFGQSSDDLFILLDGRLVARTKTGLDIAYIAPIGIVGEMGVITDQPRSADVIAFEESMGFLITKADLLNLFVSDGNICRKILLNVTKILSTKLYDTNTEIEKLREEGSRAAEDLGQNIFLY